MPTESATVRPEAIKILRQVKAFILEEPARLNMNTWFLRLHDVASDGTYLTDLGYGQIKSVPAPPCKTVGCIRGWADELAGAGALDNLLNDNQKANLYYFATWGSRLHGWPIRFSEAYTKARTPQGRARATAMRIEHFIKTGH